MIRAAYKEGSKVGTLVGRPIRDKNTYVIGMVYSSRSKGAPSFNEVEEEMRTAYINAKKSELIVKDFGSNSIQDISEEQNIKIQTASISLKSLNNIDPKVAGALYAAKNNKENISLPPMVGKNGVYKIFLTTTAVPVEKKSFQVEKDVMNKELITKLVKTPITFSQNRQRSEESYLINGLYQRANVIDNRKLLQLNIRN